MRRLTSCSSHSKAQLESRAMKVPRLSGTPPCQPPHEMPDVKANLESSPPGKECLQRVEHYLITAHTHSPGTSIARPVSSSPLTLLVCLCSDRGKSRKSGRSRNAMWPVCRTHPMSSSTLLLGTSPRGVCGCPPCGVQGGPPHSNHFTCTSPDSSLVPQHQMCTTRHTCWME